jgi:hypothetical protein
LRNERSPAARLATIDEGANDVLFKTRFLDGLSDGTITLTVRAWKRPQAKPGGRYRTPVGVLEVDSVTRMVARDLTEGDARRAGFADRRELLRELGTNADSLVYRVEFHHAGAAPEEQLRAEADLSAADVAHISERLARLDAAARDGPWTGATLELIAARPATRAADLAGHLGRERDDFKSDVRKLKRLGLTESLEIGYRLSARGHAYRVSCR